MSNPPRRSRPKRPGATIDLAAEKSGTVGYAGPAAAAASDTTSSGTAASGTAASGTVASDTAASGTAASTSPEGLRDPETRLAEEATVSAPAEDGEPAPSTAADEMSPGADVQHGRDETGLAGAHAGHGGERGSDFDDTGLAASEPDLAEHDHDDDLGATSGPPAPAVDYHAATGPATEARGGGGFGPALGAGLLGALLALAGAGALQYSGILPALGRDDPAVLAQQFAPIGDVQQVASDFAALRGDVEQLKSAQAAGGAGGGVTAGDLNAVADRVAVLEQRGNAPAVAPDTAQLGALDGVRGTADRALQAADTARRAADGARGSAERASQAVEEVRRQADTALSAATQGRQAADAATRTGTTAQQAAAAAQRDATTAQGAAEGAQKSATVAQESATAAQATATDAQAAGAAAQRTADAATATLEAMQPRMAAVEASGRQAAIAVSAAGLKSALDRGGPFMSELEAFARVGGTPASVEALRGFAAEGVPTKAALAADWPATEATVLAALRPAQPGADLGNQVLSGLSSLVTVRPAGPAPAEARGPEAVVSRLASAIEGGDLAAFLSEWETLPQAAKDAGRAYQERVSARAESERVVGDTLNRAVQAVGTAG